MLWILLTLTAAPLQVARNALQRGLVGDAGPWGATLVRFLFGLPFALAIFAVASVLTPDASPVVSWRFVTGVVAGAAAQIAGTGFLLMAMRRASFAVATLLQTSSLPLAAILGWLALGDGLSLQAWGGIVLASAGLTAVSWPAKSEAKGAVQGALLGLAAGAAFAVAFNGYRQAGVALDPAHPIYSASASLVVAQTLQSLALTSILWAFRPAAVKAVLASWRQSLGAGFFGSVASACWFGALALAPAGPVRAVGLIEAPVAAAVGRKLFRERLTLRQLLGGGLTTLGVALTALG
jgi:drug/metabolite transporter (DMT)-like permease